MIFNRHSELRDRHAFLSPSGNAWLNYDQQKLTSRFFTVRAAARGTDLHNLAHECIRLGVKLHSDNESLALYVEHGIEFRMNCEQTLYYSEHCFGSADTISFDGSILRVHDLKTGITKTSVRQLEVYAALFCLEYSVNPYDITTYLRIYQREEVKEFDGVPEQIADIMDKIIESDMHIDLIKEG